MKHRFKHNKKKRIIGTIAVVCFATAIAIFSHIHSSPAAQILISVVKFSESSLKNPEYIAHDIDLMDLFKGYMNGEVSYEGEAYFATIKDFNFSSSGSIKGKRSFKNRKLSCETDMSILWKDLGGLNVYAKDETVYMLVPMLGDDVAFAFDTGIDLFKKGPSLTSDLDKQWFHEHAKDIYTFMHSIEIKKTGDIYTDDDGIESYEYKMTIPQGQGQFIWDLLGMEAPDHDLTCSIYLDKHYSTHRVVFDLSHTMKDTSIEVVGSNLSTMIIKSNLPDNETSTMTIAKDSTVEHTNSFNCNITYEANNGHTYTIDSIMQIDAAADSVDGSITDISLKDGNDVLATGYCSGTITKEDDLGDVFENVSTDLDTIEPIDWKQIRDDTSSFINEIMDMSHDAVKKLL